MFVCRCRSLADVTWSMWTDNLLYIHVVHLSHCLLAQIMYKPPGEIVIKRNNNKRSLVLNFISFICFQVNKNTCEYIRCEQTFCVDHYTCIPKLYFFNVQKLKQPYRADIAMENFTILKLIEQFCKKKDLI